MNGTLASIRIGFVLTVLLAACVDAQPVALTAGRLAQYKDLTGTKGDKFTAKFLRDPAITGPVANPTCPNPGAVLFLRDDDQELQIMLPCANWSASGKGYRYSDKTGPIRLVLFSEGRLIVKAKGDAYGASALVGPSAFIEAEIVIGSSDFCGRFPAPGGVPKRNDPAKVAYGGPSSDCIFPTPTPTITPTPPPFPPLPCTAGNDPVNSSLGWVVCQADTSTAWISGTSVGQYRADLICQAIGYSVVRQWGGTGLSVCGVSEPAASCSSPGSRTFSCSGLLGPGPLLGNTVHWECGMTLPTPEICTTPTPTPS